MTTAKKLLLAAAALLAAVGAGLYALDDATPASTTTTTTTTAAAPGARDATRRGPRRDRDRATTAPSDARDGGDVGADTAHGDDAPGARLELEVLARDGGRLGSGLVVLFAQSGAFRTTWVAGAGTASIESLALDGLRLVLAWPGRPPQVRAVPDGAVRMSVQIADGSTVAGRVRVDGLAPQDPVRLALVALEAPWLERSALPDAVWEELGRHGFGPHEVPLTTGPGGTFRAATPTATGTAFVAIREGHLRGRDGERSFPAEVPTTVLDLDLVSLPAVTGRVVDADGAPVPGARVALVYAESGIAGTRQSDAGPDGRFLVAAHTVEITTAVLTVGASRPGARRLPVEGLRPGVRELGDVALEAERTLRLLVTDPRGRPIAGARCDAGDGATTGATDTRGALDLVLRASTDRVRVRAAGYAAQMADVPSGDAADWTVRLEPAPHVRVSVAEPPPGVRLILHLSAASALFDTDDGGFDRVLAAAGAVEPIEHGTDGAGRWSAAFVLPAAGSLDLHGLRPGTVVTYGIEDELGGLHPERPAAVPTQGAGAVVLPLTGSARRVVGRVLDPAGEPVVGAEVVLRHPGTTGFCRTVPTLPDGSFDGGIVLSDSVSVLVEQEGYAPALRDALPVPAEGSLETLRLAKGRTVRIEVCDPDGAPVDADGVEVVRPEGRLPQMRWFAEPGTRAGRHTARDLTLEDLVVLVEVRGRTVSVPCPVDADTVRVTVPE